MLGKKPHPAMVKLCLIATERDKTVLSYFGNLFKFLTSIVLKKKKKSIYGTTTVMFFSTVTVVNESDGMP